MWRSTELGTGFSLLLKCRLDTGKKMVSQLRIKILRERGKRVRAEAKFKPLTLTAGSPWFRCRKVEICTGCFCEVPIL